MELDLLAAAETESDSESNHSNQDNASGRRSVVTAATAGSEAGWSTAVFNLLKFRFNFEIFISFKPRHEAFKFQSPVLSFCGNAVTYLIDFLFN